MLLDNKNWDPFGTIVSWWMNDFGTLIPEKLKTTKQKIIYTNIMEDLFVKKQNDMKF